MVQHPNRVGGVLKRLDNHPDHLSKIGLIITDFAALEGRMCLLFWELLGEPNRANAVFWSLGSSKARSDVIRGVANELLGLDPTKAKLLQELSRLVERFRSVATKRNDIAHAQWGEPSHGGADPFYSIDRPATKNAVFQKTMSVAALQEIADEIFQRDLEVGLFTMVLEYYTRPRTDITHLECLRRKWPKLDAYIGKFE